MIVLSHRGYWLDAAEKNQPIAFHRSYDLGFGTETDVRDRGGELVIAHDIPGPSAITLASKLDILGDRDLPLAINIKSDGLGRMLAAQMRQRGLTRWFTLDMSVPDMVAQLSLDLPVFTRASEHEQSPACYDRATGIWLDAFVDVWYRATDIGAFLADGKSVCIVSPELHGRDPMSLWSEVRDSRILDHPALMICTDRPQEAALFFGART